MPELGSPTRRALGWTFHPRPAALYGREEELRLRGSLEAALRAGAGAPLCVELRLNAGADAPLELAAEGPTGRHWVERALAPAYAPGEWRRAFRRRPLAASLRWCGRRRAMPGERLAVPPPAGRVLRVLQASLAIAGAAGGLSVQLRPVRPSRLGGLADWLTAATPGPDGHRAGRPELPERGPARPVAPRARFRWSAGVALEAPDTAGARSLVRSVAAASAALDGGGLAFQRIGPTRPLPSVPLTEEEVLALLPTPEVPSAPSATAPSVRGGLAVGRAAGGQLVELPVEAGQGRHVALLGETGMGKSSLLTALGVRASYVGGVVLLDPMGETAAALRTELEARNRPFRWIAPGGRDVGVDALSEIRRGIDQDPVQAGRELDALVHALRRVRAGRYSDSAYWGPRLEEMLGRAVHAAASLPGGTLVEAHALLAREEPTRAVGAAGGRAELRELAARVQARPEDAEGARRLLFEIVRNPVLTAMLCARRPAFSIGALVQPGEVTLISGEAGAVGETTARYLLSAYLALIWAALLSRPERGKSFLLLDEAQWYGHEGLAEMLRLARRRNIHVIAATQSLGALAPDVAEAFRTNVADWVVFRGGADDAREFGRSVGGLRAESLLALPRGQAIVLVGKGESVQWTRTARWPGEAAVAGPGPTSFGGHVGRRDPPVPGLDDALAARALAVEPGGLLEVTAASLVDGGPDALRRLGGRLGRSGAIVRSERGARGLVWWLEPGRTLAALATPTRAPGAPPAEGPGRSAVPAEPVAPTPTGSVASGTKPL